MLKPVLDLISNFCYQFGTKSMQLLSATQLRAFNCAGHTLGLMFWNSQCHTKRGLFGALAQQAFFGKFGHHNEKVFRQCLEHVE